MKIKTLLFCFIMSLSLFSHASFGSADIGIYSCQLADSRTGEVTVLDIYIEVPPTGAKLLYESAADFAEGTQAMKSIGETSVEGLERLDFAHATDDNGVTVTIGMTKIQESKDKLLAQVGAWRISKQLFADDVESANASFGVCLPVMPLIL